MKILIGADIVPTESNELAFKAGDIYNLADPFVLEQLNKADYRIFNLEVPLTNEYTPIEKCGPCLRAPAECIKGIKALGTDFVTLANNHIMDQGVQGLTSTIKLLDENKIEYAGTGDSLQKAKKPHIINDGDKKIGIYCCAEHEFSIATESSPGANPFDPLNSLDHISELEKQCDYVIVLYHGGKESYRYPSPELQKKCRRMAEKGADIIICQHSHCIGCSEKWAGATIVYGQGNFLFDRNYSDVWNTGMMVLIDTELPDAEAVYIPICKENGKIRKPDEAEYSNIMDSFNLRGSEILNYELVKERYARYAINNSAFYYNRILGKIRKNRLFRLFNKLSGGKLTKKIYTKRNLLSIVNILECEAHAELFAEALRRAAEDAKD